MRVCVRVCVCLKRERIFFATKERAEGRQTKGGKWERERERKKGIGISFKKPECDGCLLLLVVSLPPLLLHPKSG